MENNAEEESKKEEKQNMKQEEEKEEGIVEGMENNAAEDESKKKEKQNMKQEEGKEEGIVEGMENNAAEDEGKKKEKQNMDKKRKHRAYGNYVNYYAKRNGGELNEDPRLQVFKKEWFEGKDCLDIGCNSGIITINIAKKFCCRSILGIDIDPDRVKDAKRNLRKTVTSISAEKMRLKEDSELKLLKQNQILGSDILSDQVKEASLNLSKSVESKSAEKKSERDHADNLEQGIIGASSYDEEIPTRNLSDVVSFKEENFLKAEYNPPEEQYDTILCLSVTQWIHLNWGDEGIMTLFSKIRDLLRPGGLFVLEPQRWKSYKRKRNVSETTALNFQNIKMRPEKFLETLLVKIGFQALIHISSDRTNVESLYNRDILVFKKSELSHAEKSGAESM